MHHVRSRVGVCHRRNRQAQNSTTEAQTREERPRSEGRNGPGSPDILKDRWSQNRHFGVEWCILLRVQITVPIKSVNLLWHGGNSLAEVRLQEGEPLENALRRFKRKVQTEDIIKEVKRHSYYLKPGEKKRVKQALARKRAKKKIRKDRDSRPDRD